MKVVFLLGRILFALLFIIKPIEHFSEQLTTHAGNMGVPAASILVPLWGAVAILGGVSILLGYKGRIGAWLLVIFLLPTTLLMHPFWSQEGFFAGMMHSLCFWKNFSLLGAALMLAYTGTGPYSVDKKP